jgi:hypothetical protein
MVAYGYYEYSTAHTLDPMLDKMNENLQQNLVSLYPNHGKNKLEVYESLPDPVKEMIWWCRTPNWLDGFPEPCGKCLACDNIRAVKEGRVPHDV